MERIRNMERTKKIPTEKEMIEQLRRGKISLFPLTLRLKEIQLQTRGINRFDALIEASWKKIKAKFAVECKSTSTPKAFQEALNYLKSTPLSGDYFPLLFLPFLSQGHLEELERIRISGIDLCGNGVVIAPDKFAVFRSGAKNQFSSSSPIKNIYRMNSSMVGRVFLVCNKFDSVQEICSQINKSNVLVSLWGKKPMSLSTVSKSLKTLEEDLIIGRGNTIRILQADKLLEKLSESYEPPRITQRLRLKVPGEKTTIQSLLMRITEELKLPFTTTGTASVDQFALMQRGDVLSIYCPRLEQLIQRLPGSETDRFPNLELIETEDEKVYFDARMIGGFRWSSPIQVYLELMSGDKRDKETADQVKSSILANVESVNK
jgi:hypothetical protein